MNVESFLAIASFAISVGGLVALFLPTGRKKETVLAVVVTALLATTGVALYGHSKHEGLLEHVQGEIIAELSDGPKTFDQIFQGVFFQSFTTVNEALFRAVEEQVIDHEFLELRADGKPILTRIYFLTD